MALPLLQLLPSSPALKDDDELQESTEGRIKNLLRRGKRKDYDDEEWKTAAGVAGITKLPAAFGGRMLRFQKELIPGSKTEKYTLRVGIVGRDNNAQYMLVVRPEIGRRFRATYRKLRPGDATVDGEERWQVVYSTNVRTGKNKIEYYAIYPKIADEPNEQDPALRAHEFVRDIVDTVFEFVEPKNGLKAPNDFERAYDDDSDKRALAKFLLGMYT